MIKINRTVSAFILLFMVSMMLVCPAIADNRVTITPEEVHVVIVEGNYKYGGFKVQNNKDYYVYLWLDQGFGYGGDVDRGDWWNQRIPPGGSLEVGWIYDTSDHLTGHSTPVGDYTWKIGGIWGTVNCGSDCESGTIDYTIHCKVIPEGPSVPEFPFLCVPISIIAILSFLVIFRFKRNN